MHRRILEWQRRYVWKYVWTCKNTRGSPKKLDACSYYHTYTLIKINSDIYLEEFLTDPGFETNTEPFVFHGSNVDFFTMEYTNQNATLVSTIFGESCATALKLSSLPVI